MVVFLHFGLQCTLKYACIVQTRRIVVDSTLESKEWKIEIEALRHENKEWWSEIMAEVCSNKTLIVEILQLVQGMHG